MQTLKPMSIKANVTLHEVRLHYWNMNATMAEKETQSKMKNKMTCYFLAYHL